jgi:hypothetical protein
MFGISCLLCNDCRYSLHKFVFIKGVNKGWSWNGCNVGCELYGMLWKSIHIVFLEGDLGEFQCYWNPWSHYWSAWHREKNWKT